VLCNSFYSETRSIALELVEHYTELAEAARVIVSTFGIEKTGVKYSKIKDIDIFIEKAIFFVSFDETVELGKLKVIADEVLPIIQEISDLWISNINRGYCYKFIGLFFQNLDTSIQKAITEFKKIYSKENGKKIVINYEPEEENKYIEVLCSPWVLDDIFNNILLNIWKHVVQRLESGRERININIRIYGEKKTNDEIEIDITNSGPLLDDNYSYYTNGHGNFKNKKILEEFGGRYAIRSNEKEGGTIVTLGFISRRSL
jgi:hypothetical protein